MTTLKEMAKDFKAVREAGDSFIKWANKKTEQHDEEMDMELEAALPVKKIKKRKAMPGEMSPNESVSDAEQAYKVNVNKPNHQYSH